MNPLISIITPAYNAERFIAATIESVLGQKYQNWEHLIVIDNNSKDRTEELVNWYTTKDPRIKLIKSSDAFGAARNRNVGLSLSKGEYIAFIDSDDVWLPNKLESQLRFMQQKSCHFSYHAFQKINQNGKKLGRVLQVPELMTYESILKNNLIGCLTVMLKSEFAKATHFQEVGWEDMAFWLDLLRGGQQAFGIPECLAYYRIVKGSRSNNKFFSAGLRWETYRAYEKLSLKGSIIYFLHYAFSGLKKYLLN